MANRKCGIEWRGADNGNIDVAGAAEEGVKMRGFVCLFVCLVKTSDFDGHVVFLFFCLFVCEVEDESLKMDCGWAF